MNKLFTTLLTLAALAIAVPAAALEDCEWREKNYTSEHEVFVDPYYVDNDFCQLDLCGFSIWIYEETNDMAGLQRDDGFLDTTCDGEVVADTIIF